MIKKLKYIVSISLVFIFMMPMFVKLFDSHFHHHEHFVCSAEKESHFHEHYEKCPIPNFEFSFFSLEKNIQIAKSLSYNVELVKNYCFTYNYDYSKYSFLLRAPPFL